MKSIYKVNKVEKIAKIENSLDKHMDKLDILREKTHRKTAQNLCLLRRRIC